MATKYWLGTGAWDTGANWSGGAKPVNTDDVIFDSASAGNLTAGPGAGVVLTSLRVTSNYVGNWGASGSPIIDVSATDFVFRSSGDECWFHPPNISQATLAPQGAGANACVIGGATTTFGSIYVAAGRVTLVTLATMGSLTATGHDGIGGETSPELIIPDGIVWSAGSKIICGAGRIQIYDAPTSTTDESVTCEGGEIWHRLGQIDRVFLKAGVYRHDAGNLGTVIQTGGYWNSRQSSEVRTIDTFYCMNAHSVADFRNDAAQGQATALVRFGNPEVYLPEGSY